jgi:hypothetical protein
MVVHVPGGAYPAARWSSGSGSPLQGPDDDSAVQQQSPNRHRRPGRVLAQHDPTGGHDHTALDPTLEDETPIVQLPVIPGVHEADFAVESSCLPQFGLFDPSVTTLLQYFSCGMARSHTAPNAPRHAATAAG